MNLDNDKSNISETASTSSTNNLNTVLSYLSPSAKPQLELSPPPLLPPLLIYNCYQLSHRYPSISISRSPAGLIEHVSDVKYTCLCLHRPSTKTSRQCQIVPIQTAFVTPRKFTTTDLTATWRRMLEFCIDGIRLDGRCMIDWWHLWLTTAGDTFQHMNRAVCLGDTSAKAEFHLCLSVWLKVNVRHLSPWSLQQYKTLCM